MANSSIPKSKAKTAYGLLSEVRAIILAEPKRYDQCDWIRTGSGPDYPSCGTVACVGGWIGVLKGQHHKSQDILGLSGYQAGQLFSYNAAKGQSQSLMHARSGAAHIRRFQKRYAKQLKAKAV